MTELTVTNSSDQIKPVTDFINQQLSEAGCPDEIRIEIDIAIDEIFGNIINYAYTPDVGPVTIRLDLMRDPDSAVITFIDQGIPFDPLSEDDPDLSGPLRTRSIGGLGLYMVRNIMDGITYRYEDGKNILSIRKDI